MPEQVTEIDEGAGVRGSDVEPARVRQMWHLLEPLHAVL